MRLMISGLLSCLALAGTGCLDKGYLDGMVDGGPLRATYYPAAPGSLRNNTAAGFGTNAAALNFIAGNRAPGTTFLLDGTDLLACISNAAGVYTLATWNAADPLAPPSFSHETLSSASAAYYMHCAYSFARSADGARRYFSLTRSDYMSNGEGFTHSALAVKVSPGTPWAEQLALFGPLYIGTANSTNNLLPADVIWHAGALFIVKARAGGTGENSDLFIDIYTNEAFSPPRYQGELCRSAKTGPFHHQPSGYLGHFLTANGALGLAYAHPFAARSETGMIFRMTNESPVRFSTTGISLNHGNRFLEVRQGPDRDLYWLHVNTASNVLAVERTGPDAAPTGGGDPVPTAGGTISQATATVLAGNTLYVAWTELRDGVQHVYAARRHGSVWSPAHTLSHNESTPLSFNGVAHYAANPAFAGTGNLTQWPDAAYLRYISGNVQLQWWTTNVQLSGVTDRRTVVVRLH